jgi:hypothetical protein
VKDKVQGKAEELKGRVTGDRATELKGKARQAVGEAKRLARDLEIDTGRQRTEPDEATETKPEPEADPSRPSRPTDP